MSGLSLVLLIAAIAIGALLIIFKDEIFDDHKTIHIITTYGCMASDGEPVEGKITGTIIRNVYDGSAAGRQVEFYQVKLDNGTEREIAIPACTITDGGIIEYRD